MSFPFVCGVFFWRWGNCCGVSFFFSYSVYQFSITFYIIMWACGRTSYEFSFPKSELTETMTSETSGT